MKSESFVLSFGFPLSCANGWVPKCVAVRDASLFLIISEKLFLPKRLATSSHTPSSYPPLFVMAFRQQLAKTYVSAQQAYDAETRQILQDFMVVVDNFKLKFMQGCEQAAARRELRCSMYVDLPKKKQLCKHRMDALKQPLLEFLMELGFPEGTVTETGRLFTIEVIWSPEDADCKVSPPQTSRGTCTTCPICQEHRSAVVLVPCGHAICRDCHRCQQLRQCPMCRAAITSATNGLFLDWNWREHCGQWWHLIRWMDLEWSW